MATSPLSLGQHCAQVYFDTHCHWKQKIFGIIHVASLRHLLTNPLEHRDAIGQPNHVVQILADVFVTCPAEPQSPLTTWLWRSIVFSLAALAINLNGLRVAVKQGEKSFPMLHHADVSDQADRRIVLRRHHQCPHLPRTSCWLRVGYPRRDLAALATAAAVVWHGHQLTPLICRPRALWHLLTSRSLEHQCTPWMSHAF